MYRTAFSKIKTGIIIPLMLFTSCKARTKQLPYYNTPDFTPVFLSSKTEVEKQVSHTIKQFSFTDQNGKTVTEKDVASKIHVANFIFTSCGSICPIMTSNMKLVQKAYKDDPDVVLLSYSVTPWIDNVARLKDYAETNGITAPNWHLLTGGKADIYTLARQSYFAEEDMGFTKDSTEFLHTEHILLIDKTRRIRGIYNGTLQLEMEQLVKDIAVLKKES